MAAESRDTSDRQQALREARQFGLIGLLNSGPESVAAKSGGYPWTAGAEYPATRDSWRPSETGPKKRPLGSVGHLALPCSAAAQLPLGARRKLWRERLAFARSGWTSGSHADRAVTVYRSAVATCEAPSWGERSVLLMMAVWSLPSVQLRVNLWREFVSSPAAADVIYRAVLTRTRSGADLKALHQALGLKRIDESMLQRRLARTRSPGDTAALLTQLHVEWPDDSSLALRLLHALEDISEDDAGLSLARKLRQRGDANTEVRTAVAEYYLRLADRWPPDDSNRMRLEAARTLGEIVEFAPDDPLARRLLGDLLRAHGWFDQAARQYKALARLTPDDSRVPLLLATTAQGEGRTEEAVRWTERAAALSSPEPSSAVARTARAFASVFLARSRHAALENGQKPLADRLRKRARRLTALDTSPSSARRVILSWAHPDLHPELWSGPPGVLSPATFGDPRLGLAQVVLTSADQGIEIRLSRANAEKAARLGAKAALTSIVREGATDEQIDVATLHFESDEGEPVDRIRLRLVEGKIVQQVSQ